VTIATVPANNGRAFLSHGRILSPVQGGYGAPGLYVTDTLSARRIPSVARAVQLYAGFAKQMAMEAYRGYTRVEPTPRLLQRPDPLNAASWFIQVSVEDYLLNGNAISLITQRGADGWPLAVMWLPVQMVTLSFDWTTGIATYNYLGEPLNLADVVHVKRGADRFYPVRGVGVVEEHLTSLDRVAMEEEYERGALSNGAVPSVAVITPQPTLTQDVADQAKSDWMEKFAGPVREPIILPNGTVVQPLAWSPSDTQLSEARRLSLLDVANMFNLDGYWLGAPVSGMTYRTAGPQYQQALKTSLAPVLADFEDVWSDAWLVRGQQLRFNRNELLREDLQTSMLAATTGYHAGIVSLEEARVMVGLPPASMGTLGTGADIAPAAPTDPNAKAPQDNEPAPEDDTPDSATDGG
jgi:HK97 family phage portal protein